MSRSPVAAQELIPVFALATPAGLELRLKVVPGASRDQFDGLWGERLKLRVAAPPEAGKANAAVLTFLGRWLGRQDLQLIAGGSSALKTVLVPGCHTFTPQQISEVM